MLVMATDASKRLKVKVKELGRYAEYGEKFEIKEDRFELLSGKNRYNAVFVIKVEEPESAKPVEMPKPAEPKVKVKAKKVTVDAKKYDEEIHKEIEEISKEVEKSRPNKEKKEVKEEKPKKKTAKKKKEEPKVNE